ncbi:MAG: undecaprenyl-diphosphate phosphatase, partial [Psychrobacter faecalis]
MDILLLIQALIMGIVEGITEFLPISSTGYLILSADLMSFWTKEKVDLFVVVVQLGAILAVIYDYWG